MMVLNGYKLYLNLINKLGIIYIWQQASRLGSYDAEQYLVL
jgi:hypothetical protein